MSLGDWTVAVSTTLPSNVQNALADESVSNSLGASFSPVAYIGSQDIGNGTNYLIVGKRVSSGVLRFLSAILSVVTVDATTTYSVVTTSIIP